MFKKWFILFLLGVVTQQGSSYAQELLANVEIMHNRIQNVDVKVFNSLKASLTEFVNNRRWTQDNFKPSEKILCSFFLNVTEPVGNPEDNMFRATLSIQASRPVFNTNYTTSTLNYMDRDVVFKYDPSQIFVFDDNRVGGSDALVANLPAIFAYYCYLILGLDYDSFSPKGGETFFKKAQNVVMNAPEDTRLIMGWKSSETNKRNRYWLVDQILNPRYAELRNFWYDYHLKGMDQMRTDPQKALGAIEPYFAKLRQVNQENPSSIYTMTIFNAKSAEFANIVSQLPMEKKEAVKKILAEVDVPNAAKYRNIR